MSNFFFASGLIFVVSGCGKSSETPYYSQAEMCDGSAELTLALRLTNRALGAPEDDIRERNGRAFVRVSGDCQYWVNDQTWFTSHGTLTLEQKNYLAEQLGYHYLESLNGQGWSTTGCFDPPTLSLSDGEHEFVCECDCQEEDTPPEVKRMRDNWQSVVQALTATGSRYEGPLRMMIREAPHLGTSRAFPWPDDIDMAPFLVTLADLQHSVSMATRIEGAVADEETSKVIRSLLAEHAEQYPEWSGMGYQLPVEKDGMIYAVDIVDELPL